MMLNKEKIIECLEKAKMLIEEWIPMFEQKKCSHYSYSITMESGTVLMVSGRSKKWIWYVNSLLSQQER